MGQKGDFFFLLLL